jgi:hypothetical protein
MRARESNFDFGRRAEEGRRGLGKQREARAREFQSRGIESSGCRAPIEATIGRLWAATTAVV